MKCAYYQALDLDALKNILISSRERTAGKMSIYDRKTAIAGESVVEYGSPSECYKCVAKPYQFEFIWKGPVCHTYYVCMDHIIGMREAKKNMLATGYGGRACRHPVDRFIWKKPRVRWT